MAPAEAVHVREIWVDETTLALSLVGAAMLSVVAVATLEQALTLPEASVAVAQ
jgi:hypothetical protein